MRKILTPILIFTAIFSFAQPNLKYSGLFDSYYTLGPVKYFVEPGISLMFGDLEEKNISGGIGAGVNYRILPPIYLNGSVRYTNLTSSDHIDVRNLSHYGNAFQLNLIGNYHIIYDRIRTNRDRNKAKKPFNLYVGTGLSLMLNHKATPNQLGVVIDTEAFEEKANITNIISKFSSVVQFPITVGIPIRITPRFTLTPEVIWYFSLSDKLDGITYNQTNNNDYYAFINLKFMFNPKGKRLKPKAIKASQSGGSGGGGSSDFDSEDDFDDTDDFNDDFEDSEEMEIEEPEIKEIEDEIIEEETNDEFIEENFEDEGEDDGEEKYDEDGFLIDEK